MYTDDPLENARIGLNELRNAYDWNRLDNRMTPDERQEISKKLCHAECTVKLVKRFVCEIQAIHSSKLIDDSFRRVVGNTLHRLELEVKGVCGFVPNP